MSDKITHSSRDRISSDSKREPYRPHDRYPDSRRQDNRYDKSDHHNRSNYESHYEQKYEPQNETNEKLPDHSNDEPDAPRETFELPETIDDFEQMDFLNIELFQGIHEYGFKYPSAIQSKTIHIINSGCDLIAQSQSGSGKTGAFAIGSLSRVNPRDRYPQVLMVANTRVLALQIHMVVQNISKYMGIDVVACVGGGKGYNTSPNNFRNAHVLVGTPGKINELLSKGIIDGRQIKILIMDETDVLLKDDFQPQIINIISSVGNKTQICIFSATFTKETLLLTEKFLRDPYRVTVVNEQLSVKDIVQYQIRVGYEENKFRTLLDLFTKLAYNQMIIFVRSVRAAENLRNWLMDKEHQAGLVHGKMESTERENVLKEFRLSHFKILIATDLMCRGIDIDDLRLVINYDMPDDKATYLHRVGRSGRYGGKGVAINFCTHNDAINVEAIKREYKISIEDMPDPEFVNQLLTGMKPPKGKVSSAKNYE